MAHKHIVSVYFTGLDVMEGEQHYHVMADGSKTSTDPYGPGHTHTYGERTTTGPIGIPSMGPSHNMPSDDMMEEHEEEMDGDGMDDMLDDDGAKKRKKRMKRKSEKKMPSKKRKPRSPKGGWGY